jgi:hypothetical protein
VVLVILAGLGLWMSGCVYVIAREQRAQARERE